MGKKRGGGTRPRTYCSRVVETKLRENFLEWPLCSSPPPPTPTKKRGEREVRLLAPLAAELQMRVTTEQGKMQTTGSFPTQFFLGDVLFVISFPRFSSYCQHSYLGRLRVFELETTIEKEECSGAEMPSTKKSFRVSFCRRLDSLASICVAPPTRSSFFHQCPPFMERIAFRFLKKKDTVIDFNFV